MLLSVEVDSISQKGVRKRNSVRPGGSAGGKMILILLAEIVALYVGPTAVDVRGLGLELVSRSTFGLEERLDDFVQVLLAVAISTRILKKKGSLRGSEGSFGISKCFGADRSLRVGL